MYIYIYVYIYMYIYICINIYDYIYMYIYMYIYIYIYYVNTYTNIYIYIYTYLGPIYIYIYIYIHTYIHIYTLHCNKHEHESPWWPRRCSYPDGRLAVHLEVVSRLSRDSMNVALFTFGGDVTCARHFGAVLDCKILNKYTINLESSASVGSNYLECMFGALLYEPLMVHLTAKNMNPNHEVALSGLFTFLIRHY